MPWQTLQELWVMKVVGAGGGNRKIPQVVTLLSVLGLDSRVWRFGAVWSIRHTRVWVGNTGRQTVKDLKILEQFYNTLRTAGLLAQRLLQRSKHPAPPAPSPFNQWALLPFRSMRSEVVHRQMTGQSWVFEETCRKLQMMNISRHCCHLLSEHSQTRGKKLAE